MCCFREVDDPRKRSNGTLHDFQEILVIAIAAVLIRAAIRPFRWRRNEATGLAAQ